MLIYIISQKNNPKFVAVGEIGLDFHEMESEMEYIKNNNCEREIQFSIFSRLELFYRNAQKDKWEEKYYHLDGKYVRLL